MNIEPAVPPAPGGDGRPEAHDGYTAQSGLSGQNGEWPVLLHALECGDWRRAMVRLQADGSSQQALAAVAGLLALSMFCQAVGDVLAAWSHLGDVARILPETLTRQDARESVRRVNLPKSTDAAGAAIPPVMLALCRIAWREQSELFHLRDRFRAPGRTPREELVDACVEYQIWVDFDPWTWRREADPHSPQTGVVLPQSFGTPQRKDMCARASALRKLAVPELGDLSESVWKDIGGYRGLRGQALRRLADRPLVPWQLGPGPGGSHDVPVRRGRRAAWNYAQSWAHDL